MEVNESREVMERLEREIFLSHWLSSRLPPLFISIIHHSLKQCSTHTYHSHLAVTLSTSTWRHHTGDRGEKWWLEKKRGFNIHLWICGSRNKLTIPDPDNWWSDENTVCEAHEHSILAHLHLQSSSELLQKETEFWRDRVLKIQSSEETRTHMSSRCTLRTGPMHVTFANLIHFDTFCCHDRLTCPALDRTW